MSAGDGRVRVMDFGLARTPRCGQVLRDVEQAEALVAVTGRGVASVAVMH